MTQCQHCGAPNEDDSEFCRNCSAYLGWSRSGRSPKSTEEPEGNDTASSERRTPSRETVAVPLTDEELRRRLAERTAAVEGDDAAAVAGRRSAEPAGADQVPDAVDARRVCAACGTANDAVRRFCRRCGAVLAEATSPPPVASASRAPPPQASLPPPSHALPATVPWWRFRDRPRPGAPFPPGDSADDGGFLARARFRLTALSRTGQVLLVIGVALVFVLLLGPVRSVAADVWGRLFPRAVYVPPAQQEGDQGLVDGTAEEVWYANRPLPLSSVVTFDEPVDLYKVGILSGSASESAGFQGYPRPRRITITAKTSDRRTITSSHDLADEPGFASFSFSADKVKTVEIRVDSAYGQPRDDRYVAIREIEFFRRD